MTADELRALRGVPEEKEMTKTLEEAREELKLVARYTNKAYLYRLRDGYLYVSPSPPSTINAEFIEASE